LKKVLYSLLRKYISSYREFLELIRRDDNLYSPRFQKLIKLENEVRGTLMMLKEKNLVEYERERYSLSERGKELAKELCRKQIYQD
jgi:predicted transcriptional regulator